MKQKKLNAGFSKVTITDDTGNNEVDGDAPDAAQSKYNKCIVPGLTSSKLTLILLS
jgi:hypothetical protein